MELKKGYKQTEIGVIPEDWVCIKLGDYIILKNGFALRSEYFSNRGPIVTTPRNFKLSGGLKFDERKTIRFSGSYSKQMCFDNGDLIMVMTDLTPNCNLLGKSGIVETDEILLHNQRIGKIIIINDKVSKRYLNVFFNSFLLSKRMKSTATGSTVRHTSVPTIKNSLVPLPPLPEQKTIAQVLTDTDALIQNLKTLIVKKQAIKQGTMQQLLIGKKRLEGFGGKWEMKKLGEMASFFKGKSLSKSQLKSDGNYKCIHYGELFTKYSEVISNIKSRTDLSENVVTSRVNDILMPTSDVTPNGLATASCINEDGVILGGDILVIRVPSNLLNGIFFSYLITISKDSIMQLVTGSTVYHLYGSDMSQFKFKVPKDIEEQKAIAQILSDMDAEIEGLETQLHKTQALKQGMMKELLTGKTRLPVENYDVEEDELLLAAEDKADYKN